MNSNAGSQMPREDLDLIRQCGAPTRPSATYVHFAGNDRVSLTERGRRLYRMACLLHGLCPEVVEEITNTEDLRALSLKIKRAWSILRQDELERARRNGRVPVKARAIVDAMLFGTREALQAAMEQRILCESAGANVIPVDFASKRNPVFLDQAVAGYHLTLHQESAV